MPNFNSQKGLACRQAGAIPLLVLVAIGVATLVGGAYAIKSEFIKLDKGTISLDMTKVQKQQVVPKPPATQNSPTNSQSGGKSDQAKSNQSGSNATQPTPTPQLAPSKVTVAADTEKGQPGFTINPPAGWNNTGRAGFAAYFEAPEEDEAEMVGTGGGVQKSKATVQIRFLPFNYKELKEAGKTESQILDEAAKAIKKSMDPAAPTYLTDRRTTFAGQDAQLIEAKVRIKLDTSQIEEMKNIEGAYWDARAYGYYLVKGNYVVAVAGTALDDAWGKRAGQIQSSIKSFKFTE